MGKTIFVVKRNHNSQLRLRLYLNIPDRLLELHFPYHLTVNKSNMYGAKPAMLLVFEAVSEQTNVPKLFLMKERVTAVSATLETHTILVSRSICGWFSSKH